MHCDAVLDAITLAPRAGLPVRRTRRSWVGSAGISPVTRCTSLRSRCWSECEDMVCCWTEQRRRSESAFRPLWSRECRWFTTTPRISRLSAPPWRFLHNVSLWSTPFSSSFVSGSADFAALDWLDLAVAGLRLAAPLRRRAPLPRPHRTLKLGYDNLP